MGITALDLPASWQTIAATDEITTRILAAVNGMLLDMLAAIARNYTDRRCQAEGIAKAEAVGAYKGAQRKHRAEYCHRVNAV